MMKKVFCGIAAALAVLCLLGCPDDGGGSDPVQNELKITIPAEVEIVGVGLMENLNSQIPVVVGVNANGTFKLFEYDGENDPPLGKKWTGSGEYYVMLANSFNDPSAVYTYTEGKNLSANQNAVKYSFTGNTSTIAWSQFRNMAEQQLIMSVTGITAAKPILVAVLLDSNSSPVAVAFNSNGTFVFSLFENNLPGGPFYTAGNYGIVLSDSMDMNPDSTTRTDYVYMDTTSQIPVMAFNFDTSKVNVIPWANFKDRSLLQQ